MPACRIAVAAAVLWLAGHSLAAAQAFPRFSITSTGTATVEAAPEYAEFWLHRRIPTQGQPVIEETAERAATLGRELREALAEADLNPRVEVSTLMVGTPTDDGDGPGPPSIRPEGVGVSARLQFTLLGFAAAESGPKQFAAICDRVLAIAERLGCEVDGPHLKVLDEDALHKSTVAAAVERAYAPADGAAGILRAQIVAVESVHVRKIEWNNAPGHRLPVAQLGRVTCTATVEVTYMFETR